MLPEYISDVLIVGGFLFVSLALALLVWVCMVEVRRRGQTGGGARNDLANMMMLLQTMRDLLEQQKGLAHDFNRSVDKKVGVVREVVKAVGEEQRRLNRRYTELKEMMAETKADLARIRSHAAAVKAKQVQRGGIKDAEPMFGRTAVKAPDEVAEVGTAAVAEEEVGFPPLEALATPRESDSASDLIDKWRGCDFKERKQDPYAFDVPEETPAEPGDPENHSGGFSAIVESVAAVDRGGVQASGFAVRVGGTGRENPGGSGPSPKRCVLVFVSTTRRACRSLKSHGN